MTQRKSSKPVERIHEQLDLIQNLSQRCSLSSMNQIMSKKEDKNMHQNIIIHNNHNIGEPNTRLTIQGIGAIRGRFLLGTAEKIPSSELVDTTGAGDAFIGVVFYGSLVNIAVFGTGSISIIQGRHLIAILGFNQPKHT
ncbi:hypothetical protein Syun_029985 [Stephania yunnanensis]|uniref:Carbohydrate kinase PfkB domain-containing protein n=1 Tax=Stephania yunnanensis TaxID=152371 RepID=A0AAP0E6M3_9MAGN